MDQVALCKKGIHAWTDWPGEDVRCESCGISWRPPDEPSRAARIANNEVPVEDDRVSPMSSPESDEDIENGYYGGQWPTGGPMEMRVTPRYNGRFGVSFWSPDGHYMFMDSTQWNQQFPDWWAQEEIKAKEAAWRNERNAHVREKMGFCGEQPGDSDG